MAKTAETQPVENAILITHTPRGVVHTFITQASALQEIQDAFKRGEEAVMIHFADHQKAELIYRTSPNVQSRVSDAKASIHASMQLKKALDQAGVPTDLELREKIHTAVNLMQTQGTPALRAASGVGEVSYG